MKTIETILGDETQTLPLNPHTIPSRREFLRIAGALIAGNIIAPSMTQGASTTGRDPGPLPTKALVGSQIYGWGQYYERMGKNWSDHLDQILSALRDSGFDYLEGFVDLNNPENMAGFADQLRQKGLKPVSLYTGGRLHEAGKSEETVSRILEAAKVCHKAGFKVINCNPDPIGREKTDEELQVQAKALTTLGKGLSEHEIKLGIHNHTPALLNHGREFHHNFRQTPSAWVGFCFDVHWIFRGGIAPMAALQEYSERIVSWHLRQSREKIWWEDLDTGDIDYSQIADYNRSHPTTPYYTVELALESGTKITRGVVENHRRSRDFVRTVFQA